MQAVWLRGTFFIANSSPLLQQHCHPCSMQNTQLSVRCRVLMGALRCRKKKDELQIPSLYSFAQPHWPARMNGLARLKNHGEKFLSPKECHIPLLHAISPTPLLLPPSSPVFSHLLSGWIGGKCSCSSGPGKKMMSQKNKKWSIISTASSSSPQFPIPGAWYNVCLPCQAWGLCIAREGGFLYIPKMPP